MRRYANLGVVTFMDKIIDYAGLFPPASLDLDTAIQNYRKYYDESEHWMLSRFIIPAKRLTEITPEQMGIFTKDKPLKLSLLTSDLAQDVQVIHLFEEKYSDVISLDLLETRFSGPEFEDYIDYTGNIIEKNGWQLRPFFELPFDNDWDAHLEDSIGALATYNKNTVNTVGFKLRCGGIKASMVPSSEQIANTIIHCRNRGVSVKFTAGLHHPIRHFDEKINAYMHGFVNIFGGAMLASAHDLSVDQIIPIIAEEDADQFVMSDDVFGWRDLTIASHDIMKLRQAALISYGSCSFDEPREDLHGLGWL